MIFLTILLVPILGYALLLSFLPARAAGVLVLLSLLLFGFLWTRPRYYLLRGGNNSVIINEQGTGRNWTFTPPLYFGEIDNLGKFAASLLGVGLGIGGIVAYKVRQDRAARKLAGAESLDGRGLGAGNLS